MFSRWTLTALQRRRRKKKKGKKYSHFLKKLDMSHLGEERLQKQSLRAGWKIRLIELFLYFFTSYYEKHLPLPQFNLFHDLMQISFPLKPANNVCGPFFLWLLHGDNVKKSHCRGCFRISSFPLPTFEAGKIQIIPVLSNSQLTCPSKLFPTFSSKRTLLTSADHMIFSVYVCVCSAYLPVHNFLN